MVARIMWSFKCTQQGVGLCGEKEIFLALKEKIISTHHLQESRKSTFEWFGNNKQYLKNGF